MSNENCHEHVIRPKVSVSDRVKRAHAYENKVASDHARWAKGKARRINQKRARKINRAA